MVWLGGGAGEVVATLAALGRRTTCCWTIPAPATASSTPSTMAQMPQNTNRNGLLNRKMAFNANTLMALMVPPHVQRWNCWNSQCLRSTNTNGTQAHVLKYLVSVQISSQCLVWPPSKCPRGNEEGRKVGVCGKWHVWLPQLSTFAPGIHLVEYCE